MGCGLQATEEILRLVLQVMISDRSVSIRKALLWSLDEWFDAYLSREHHIGVSVDFVLSVLCWG